MDPPTQGGSAPDHQVAAPAPMAPGSLAAQWDRVLTTPRGTRRARMSLGVALALLVVLATLVAWQGFLHSAVAVRLGSMNEIVFAGGKNLDSADSPSAVPELYVMRPDGTGLHQLTHLSDGGYFSPVWSPDGTRIAAYTVSGSDVIAHLVVMDADGSHARIIPAGALSLEAFNPSAPTDFLSVSGLISWSPDGSQLVAELGLGLYMLVNVDGTHPRIFNNALFPVWSPDGRYLAYYTGFPNDADAQQSNGGFTIALLDTQTMQRRVLNGLPGLSGEALAWSPDGRYLAMSAPLGNDAQFQTGEALLLVRPDATGLKVVDHWQDEVVQQITWSPDSQKLAVVVQSLDNGQQGNGAPTPGFGLLVLNADGSHIHQVGFGDGGEPSWSPDGKHLVYASPDDSALQIVDTSAQGGATPRALTGALGFLFAPCWSPLAGV
ncbi:MAG TPA: hypothetical protein VKT82_05710 [Ktedonobacterales bacterium]|nr:hypothetical protein [Ktedonobacterales bacterium]